MPNGFVPSWIQPANEVANLAHGYQIGLSIGAQQAERTFREQQMMRQQQLAAQDRAQWEAEFGLRAKQAADKAAAIKAYQSDIAGGMDPIQAIMKHGPSMQEPGAVQAAALRSPQLMQQNAIRNLIDQQKLDVERQKLAQPPKPPTSVQEVDEILKNEAQANEAEKAGNMGLAQQLRDRASLLREQMKGQQVVTGYDDQGRPIVTVGKGAGLSPTVATASRAQQKLQKYENATEVINRLQGGLEAGHVGVAGLAGEYLWDRGLVQALNMMGDPNAQADPNRVNSRAGLVMLRESLMREISDDPRFSNLDREEISKALPSTGAFESLSDAKTKLNTVRDIITKRARVYSKSIGRTEPLWAMSPEEIRAAMKEGKIDQKTALDALVRFH